MRNLLLFLTIFTVVVLTGCDKTISTIKVSGTVKFDGVPLADASISFSPETEGEGLPAYGTTDANGNYLLQTAQGKVDAGTTPGKYQVTIRKMEKTAVTEAPAEYDGTSSAPSSNAPRPKSLIPERYAQTRTSGLTATVDKENTVHNFDLTK
jgi:hypothetical protein